MGQIERSDGRKLYQNTTYGSVGALVYKPNGDEKAVAVQPQAKIWLSDEEVELTLHSHIDPANSPFADHDYELRGPDGQTVDSGRRPLLAPVMEEPAEAEEETGDSQPPHTADSPGANEAPPGQYQDGEEQGGAQPLQTSQAIQTPAHGPLSTAP